MTQINNPVALESKRRLVTALLALMEEKSYFKINIQELATRAGMDRRTFYRNFDSKEDVLRRYMNIFLKRFVMSLKVESELNIDNTIEILINSLDEYKTFLVLLNKSGIVFFLLEYLNQNLNLIMEIIKERSPYSLEANFEDKLAYSIGGTYNFLVRNLMIS